MNRRGFLGGLLALCGLGAAAKAAEKPRGVLPHKSVGFGVPTGPGKWQILAWNDAPDKVVDAGFYRFAYCGPIIYYPPGDEKGRRIAREMAAYCKKALR